MGIRENIDFSTKHYLAGPHGVLAGHMTADERLREIAAILAAGALRLRAKQSSQVVAGLSDFPLHSVAEESVCRTDRNGGTT
jgi:hypothetical protein